MKLLPSLSIAKIIFILLFSQLAVSKDVDKETGLINGTGLNQVKAHCTACHSAKLVSQNRMTRSGWLETIRWMQKTQGLWPLGSSEEAILNYLEKNYSPLETGRRRALSSGLRPPQ